MFSVSYIKFKTKVDKYRLFFKQYVFIFKNKIYSLTREKKFVILETLNTKNVST